MKVNDPVKDFKSLIENLPDFQSTINAYESGYITLAEFIKCALRKQDECIVNEVRKEIEQERREKYAQKFVEGATGKVFNRSELEKYCRENFDWGDPTNMMTYQSKWWEEYGFTKIEED